MFHGQKWRQIFEPIKIIDVIFAHETLKKMAYFLDKSSWALEFLLPIVSKLKFINLERSYCVFSSNNTKYTGHFFIKNIFSEMGVVFLEHPGGARYFCCMNCKAPLTNRSELVGFHKWFRVGSWVNFFLQSFMVLRPKKVLKWKLKKSSTRFTGATGRAYLFNKVVNVSHSAAACRIMLTGRHIVSS